MEDHGVLSWGGWSAVRKAQVLGALAGGCLTAGPAVAYLIGCTTDSHSYLAVCIAYLFAAVMSPAAGLCGFLGCTWTVDPGPRFYWRLITAVVLGTATNAALFALVGTLLGWLYQWAKRGNRPRGTD